MPAPSTPEPPTGAPTRRHGRGAGLRRWVAVRELLAVAAICYGGFYLGAEWLRNLEASWVAAVLNLAGFDGVSGVLPGRVLIFPENSAPLNAVVTASCSSILSIVGLAALTFAVLRGRGLHAVSGLATAIGLVLVLNHLRLLGSALAGLYWGESALVLFHDWVGTLWNFAATLLGLLVMVSLALPSAERSEQSAAGVHTARRPAGWAHPGLGYRLDDDEDEPTLRRRSWLHPAILMHRHVLPAALTRRLAARREASRIDYRIGHLDVEQRAQAVAALAADGLGAHAASLVAVATWETDCRVLDALADAVAARQWEPVTHHRVTMLRLWARGWMLARGRATTTDTPVDTPVAASVDTPALMLTRPAVPSAPAVAPVTVATPVVDTTQAASASPAEAGTVSARSFARRGPTVPVPATDLRSGSRRAVQVASLSPHDVEDPR